MVSSGEDRYWLEGRLVGGGVVGSGEEWLV